jgi:type IV pilus assembly protein PilW
VLLQTESRKRTSTAGSDATTTGAMGLYTIERDARNAGYGMTAQLAVLGCEIRMQFAGNPTETFTLAPVTITQGANGTPDTIRFMASNKEGVPVPIRVAVDHPPHGCQLLCTVRSGRGRRRHHAGRSCNA